MPKPRASGGRASMRRPSIQILPAVSGSSPARQFSAVDLPQPDGPSRATNSPPLMVSSRSCSANRPAKLRLTRSSRNSAKRASPLVFIGSPPCLLRSPALVGWRCSLAVGAVLICSPPRSLRSPALAGRRCSLAVGSRRPLLRLPAPDLAVPLVERGDLLLGRQRGLLRERV